MANTAQQLPDVRQSTLNDLIRQVSNHHAALLRTRQFCGQILIDGFAMRVKVEEDDAILLVRNVEFDDPLAIERLKSIIKTLQQLMPVTAAFTSGGAA
ncbi:hypothetical protein [Idiomarina aminovorans]|uniref:hypothetical protein n=1 Tax=Idiomarina aminovorans TaxID=2914829 RepID=UPI00200687A3|nr:hypothetical protein [Idiomarina sp. ATCH4]MCK7458470.1 hypothetical protein [Idiomarina sp. ATCH4]